MFEIGKEKRWGEWVKTPSGHAMNAALYMRLWGERKRGERRADSSALPCISPSVPPEDRVATTTRGVEFTPVETKIPRPR